MVATRLSEVTAKGIEWMYGSSSSSSAAAPAPSPAETSASSNDDYLTYARKSFHAAMDASSATLSSLMASIYVDDSTNNKSPAPSPEPPLYKQPPVYSFGWMLQNPYSTIRGNHDEPSSLSAVRSLLTLVPTEQQEEESLHRQDTSSSLDVSIASLGTNVPVMSRAETASQLAEGTIRALRDLELDEAMELYSSLRYWTARWERPLLSFVEAGPWIWFSEEGYNHKVVGQRVSQLQAVLARRCAAIGELQQHLLRAGWQTGVAQWGVLGRGQWTAVTGFDGAMEERGSLNDKKPEKHDRRLSTYNLDDIPVPEHDSNDPLYYGNSNICVRKTDGGAIMMDDPALAAWSVDAIRVVRDQVYRAGNGLIPLPCPQNWLDADSSKDGELICEGFGPSRLPVWASWEKKPVEMMGEDAELHTLTEEEEMEEDVDVKVEIASNKQVQEDGKVVITDLNLMASEVSELLDSVEIVMAAQRNRRLEKLKGYSYFRRNWFQVAVGAPFVTYLVYRLAKDGSGRHLATLAVEKVTSFIRDHVYGPVSAIFSQLFTRKIRDTISDRKARLEAIDSLKKMIQSWLDETYPTMEEAERQTRAENMDMSLIEMKKEENMKTIFEINSVVRMSLIEMQFIKKEMMNALYAIDEMMTSNEINMNLAAVTPAVLLLYSVKHVFRFFFYAFLKVGKSKEQIYSSFRHVILDIERLLVMRDSPPSVPPPLTFTEDGQPITLPASVPEEVQGPSVLSSDDLGMLMLQIHDCRTMLWENRRRFSRRTLREIGEDLAELAGERGAVSVQQQLQIVARMCRTYSFLKVISTGVVSG